METASNKTWELPARLADDIPRSISHHVTEKEVKKKILMENPVSSNIKETPTFDNYIKELLLENKKELTLNHEEAVKGIHDKVSNVFVPLLWLWALWKKRKKLYFKS